MVKPYCFCIFMSMKDSELIQYLQQQNATLLATLESLTKTVESQSKEIKALKELLLERDGAAQKLKRLADLNLPKKTEKRKYTTPVVADKTSAPTPKERGNNGAKRKSYDNLEEVVEDVLPSDITFNEQAAVYLFHRDVIRYKYIPPRLIKYIYRCKTYRMGDLLRLKISHRLKR